MLAIIILRNPLLTETPRFPLAARVTIRKIRSEGIERNLQPEERGLVAIAQVSIRRREVDHE
jgi:hypothetical protein